MANPRAKKGSQRAVAKRRGLSQKHPKKALPPRQPWVFVEAAVNEDREERQVRALEFIAQFLDRIELQLERIADDIELAILEESRPES